MAIPAQNGLRARGAAAVLTASFTFVAGLGAADLPEPLYAPLDSPIVNSPVERGRTIPVANAALGIGDDAQVSLSAMRAASAAVPSTVVAGRTTGTFGVTNSGAASYTIPIWTPPGIGTVDLKLSLSYNSRGSNGILGYGWSIGGLSAITRCNKTVAQDGAPAAVTNSLSDRFCLDGQQLKLASGYYGQAGSTYATEVESFSRITASGVMGAGPASFTVTTKNGLIYEYGTTSDSQVFAGGSSGTIRTWALSRIRDRLGGGGNRIDLSYTNEAANGNYTNGTYRIDTITYPTTATNQGPFYRVKFNYAARPVSDVPFGYLGGNLVREQNKLDSLSIQDFATESTIKSYNFSYEQGPSTNRLRLASIQECSAQNCLRPTTIAYQDGVPGWSTPATSLGAATADASRMLSIDLNGDGIQDLIYATAAGAYYNWQVAYGTASGTHATPVALGISTATNHALVPGDFAGEGQTDLLYDYGGTWYRLYWNGSGLSAASTGATIATGEGYSGAAASADVNGDGLPDLVWYCNQPTGGAAILYVQLNTTTPGAPVSFQGTPVEWYRAQNQGDEDWSFIATDGMGSYWSKSRSINVADFNGDGRADLLVQLRKTVFDGCSLSASALTTLEPANLEAGDDAMGVDACAPMHTYYWRPLLSTGASFLESASYVRTAQDMRFGFIDWNGDGCTDLYGPATVGGTFRIYTALCASAGSFAAAIDTGASWSDLVMVADWDADGRQDLLTGVSGSGNWKVRRSTGEGVASAIDSGVAVGNGAWFVTDVNGDGLADLGWVDQAAGNQIKLRRRAAANVYPDLALSFTDGFGMSQSPTYVSMAQSSHTKYSTAQFPEADIQVPLPVVNQFTATDGAGGVFQKQFYYFGARMHLQGRGFEGFEAQRSYDSRNGLYTYDYVKQAFPFTGMHWQQTVYQSSWKLLNGWSATVADQTLGSALHEQRRFPYIASLTEQRRELDESTVSSSSIGFQYGDGYGNPTRIDITVTDLDQSSPFNGQSWQSSVVSTFSNDTVTNCLGLPLTSSITKSAPGQSPRSTAASYSVDAGFCRIKEQVLEPNTPAQKITSTASFDACGNVSRIRVVGATETGASMSARDTSMNFGPRCQLPETITNAMGEVSVLEFDYRFGVRTRLTDPNVQVTSWEYDDFGRQLLETRPDLTKTSWAYDSCSVGPCWGVNDLRSLIYEYEYGADGSHIRTANHFYDGYERLRYRQAHRVLGTWTIEETYEYDNLGRLSVSALPFSANNPAGFRLWTYDVLGRPTEERLYRSDWSLDRRTTFASDGLSTAITDPRGFTRTLIHDVLGQLRRVKDPPANATTSYDYDALGNLNRIQDADGAVSTGTYNNHGFMTAWTDADRGAWTFKGNSLSERVEWRNAKQQVFYATYDRSSRLKSRTEPDGASYFVYGSSAANHNIGKLVSMTRPGYGEERQFDAKARLATRTIVTDQTYEFGYAYSSAHGELETLTYPSSPVPTGKAGPRFKVKYSYSYGEPFKIDDVTEPAPAAPMRLWQLTETNDSSLPQKELLGPTPAANVSSSYRPWTNELLTRQAGASTTLNNRQNLAYDWDATGNLTTRQDALLGASETFTYDPLNRLKTAQRSSLPPVEYDYSPSGNLTSRTGIGSLSYGDPAHPHAVTSNGSRTFTYDANGNQVSRDGLTQTWASFDLPTTLRSAGYSSTLYYGPQHQRYKQVATYANGTETTHYVGDGLLEKESATSVAGTFWRHYVTTGTGSIVVSRSSAGAESIRYLLTDHLGSTDTVLDAQGNEVLRESFSPLGKRRGSDWTETTAPNWTAIANTTRRGFTGHEMLDSVGLVHMNGRVYDPDLGRFMSVDPIIGDLADSQTVNPYAYVGYRTLTLTDPTGFDGCIASCYVAAQVAKFIVATVVANLFGGSSPPPPPAIAVPGQSAQNGVGLCGPGTISPVCGGAFLAGQTVETSPSAELPTTREIVVEVLIAVVPGVSTAKGVYDAYVVFSDPATGWQERFVATLSIIPGGRVLTIGSKIFKVVDKGRRAARGAAAGTTRVKSPLQTPERVIVDWRGNAIPLNKGETLSSSPDGRWVQVRDANGNPTGVRVDGPHNPRTHPDPRAQQPHAHVPGVTNPDGTPWLPIN